MISLAIEIDDWYEDKLVREGRGALAIALGCFLNATE